MTGLKRGDSTCRVDALEGKPTLRVAYFFSGIPRKASIAAELERLCRASGFGLLIEEIDLYVGGKEHDLMDKRTQDLYLAKIAAGDYDLILLSPPCGSWSRANYKGPPGPEPCRSRAHPWGLPNMLPNQRKRGRGQRVRALLAQGDEFRREHAETRRAAPCPRGAPRGSRAHALRRPACLNLAIAGPANDLRAGHLPDRGGPPVPVWS